MLISYASNVEQPDQSTWYSWKYHKCWFLKYKEGRLELVFVGNFCQTTYECIYKMLVACVIDNEGRSILISWMLCSSLLLQTLLIAIKTQHSWYTKTSSLLYKTCTISAHTKFSFKMQLFSKLKCTPRTRLETESALKKTKGHVWMWHFHEFYVHLWHI